MRPPNRLPTLALTVLTALPLPTAALTASPPTALTAAPLPPTALTASPPPTGAATGASSTVTPVRVTARPVAVAAVIARPTGPFRWPLDGTPVVVRRFDPPPEPWLAGHRGVDLAATAGVPVRAAGGGVVVYAGRIAGRGVVSIGHAGGLRTTYEPVRVAAGLSEGTPVPVGTVLGVLAAGHPGCPSAACLHWGLRRGQRYLDPLALLGLGRVRLLPLGGA